MGGDLQWKDVAKFRHSDQDPIECADIAADGNRIITGSSRGRITVWDARSIDPPQGTEAELGIQPEPEETVQDENSDKDYSERALLTISRLRSAIRSVAFTANDSGVIALEVGSENAVWFPATPLAETQLEFGKRN